MDSLCFRAKTTTGASRGRKLNAPTINLRVEEVPDSLKHGIYACRAGVSPEEVFPAVMHYGPKPIYNEGPSCEVHFLDRTVEMPTELHVEVGSYLRAVQNFDSEQALMEQIHRDIAEARAILGS